MRVTIKDIADACGVSRGTVDRVLNKRGGVSKKTQEKIMYVADELGYECNTLGKALASMKKHYVIGIILCSEGNEFYDDMIEGINQAASDNSHYNLKVILKTMKGYDPKQQLLLIEELEGQVNSLIINTINDNLISNKLDYLVDSGTSVFTLNSDIENSKRICHIGVDVLESGKIACGLLGIIKNPSAKVAIGIGSLKLLEHKKRLEGFLQTKAERYPHFEIHNIFETDDDETNAYIKTRKILKAKSSIDSFYIAGGTVAGICKAVEEENMQDKIVIISHDNTSAVKHYMEKGIIKATISQEPYMQGYKALDLTVQYLTSNILPDEHFLIENRIKIYENLETVK